MRVKALKEEAERSTTDSMLRPIIVQIRKQDDSMAKLDKLSHLKQQFANSTLRYKFIQPFNDLKFANTLRDGIITRTKRCHAQISQETIALLLELLTHVSEMQGIDGCQFNGFSDVLRECQMSQEVVNALLAYLNLFTDRRECVPSLTSGLGAIHITDFETVQKLAQLWSNSNEQICQAAEKFIKQADRELPEEHCKWLRSLSCGKSLDEDITSLCAENEL